ncbi:MAG: hypothetical protein ACXADH_16105 [Candidatus Kariarchaeaceae archaeon]|jgi:hypothetical protein
MTTETNTEPSAPPEEVWVTMEGKKIDYEDLRVIAMEKKGPLDPSVKELIQRHYVRFNSTILISKLRILNECNEKRGLDKFERCEREIMKNIERARIKKSDGDRKESCTIA